MKREKPSSGDDLSTQSEDSSASKRSSGSGHRKKRLASSTAVPVVAVPVCEGSETINAKSSTITTSEEKISKPEQSDVLFGRGKPYQGHPGNTRLHKIVDVYRSRYMSARRYDKFAIAEEIVRNIQAPPESGRFLKRAEGGDYWEEVSGPVAREKVSHALRGKPRNDNFASSGGQHADEELLGGAAISGASAVYLYGRPASGALPGGAIPGLPLSRAGGPMTAYTNPQLGHMIPSAAAGLPYYPPGVRLPPSAGLLGLPAHPATFHRAQPLVLTQGQPSGFNGMPIEMLSDEQLIQAMLQRRQMENARFGGFPPNYY